MNLSVSALTELYSTGCLLCGKSADLVVDHDHACCPESATSCGRCVRGALCRTCNVMVGYFDRSPELAKEAWAYSRRSDHLPLDPYFAGTRVRRGPYHPRMPYGKVRLDDKGRVGLAKYVDGTPTEFIVESLPGGSVRLTPKIVG